MNNKQTKEELIEYINELKDLKEKGLVSQDQITEIEGVIDMLNNFNTSSMDETNFKVKINFINNSGNPDPSYEKEGDSGFDLRANIEENLILKPGETKLIPTGLHVELVRGYELQVRSRSGLSVKNNVFVLNSPGTVDYLYTDEIKVILTNLGKTDFMVENGMRIAQGVISPVASEHIIKLEKIEKFDNNRHRGGFGSTGLK
jgi:dUTP pyrophosphatase